MPLNARILALVGAAALTCCASPDTESSNTPEEARYVDAATLARGEDPLHGNVLTSIELKHVAADEVEARLRAELPAEVLTGYTGRRNALLVQGPRDQVVAVMKIVETIDVP